jgi:hypothetical protein
MMKTHFVVAFLIVMALAAAVRAGGLEDGIYFALDGGAGKRIKRNDGAEVVLGQRVGQAFGKVALRSVANDNSKFVLELKGAGPVGNFPAAGRLLVIIDGVIAGAWSQSDRHGDGTVDLSCNVHGQEAARKVAERLKIDMQVRKHPGHRFEVRWTPEKEAFEVGEPVTLKLQIRNTGTVPFTFMAGGKQRGPRDNQFRFLAYSGYGMGKAVPDTGDPLNFGGIASYQTLKPGDTFTRSIGLDKWFQFTAPDFYRITGIYELQLYDGSAQNGFSVHPVWDHLAVGDCQIHIMAKAK